MNVIKKIFSVAASLMIFISGISVNNSVYAENKKNITLLGDSITIGFGLSEEEMSYGAYLGIYFDGEVDNFAVNGQTTEELLEELDEYEVSSSVQQSDLVCISIGGNDFLSIFEKAYEEIGGGVTISEGQLDISSEFVSKFIMDYSSAFGSAAVTAGENIEKIRDKIKEINPDTQIVMQTIYNPLESENPEKNVIMAPLKTFASLYLGTINNSIKEISPTTADIYLKFSNKPYLYTNIESYDIHPNAIGHMLIAEEIIQVIAENGNNAIFKDSIYNIPQGIFAKFPEYIADELNQLAEGKLRRGTLEQSIEKTVSANVEVVETEEITQEETKVVAENVIEEKEDEEENKVKNLLSRIFLVMGMSIILGVSLKRYWKKKRMK